MSLNWLLVLNVAISCGFIILKLLQFRVISLWRYLPALLAGGTLFFCYRRDVETAGYYSGSVFFVLILLPWIVSESSNSRLSSRRFRSAYTLSWLAWLLHPTKEMRDQPRLIQALALLHQKENGRAERILQSLCLRRTSAGRTAYVMLTRMHGSWQQFVNSIHRSADAGRKLADPMIANTYLQALGEIGQTDLLVKNFAQGILKRKRGVPPVMLNVFRMKVAAFCGRTDLVATILDGPLRHFDSPTRRFWIATSMQAAGRINDARSMFDELQSVDDQQIAIAATRRITAPVRRISDLTPEMSQALSEIESALQHESQFAVVSASASRPPYATWGLVTILGLVFIAEMINGGVGRLAWESTTLSIWERFELLHDNTMDNANLIDMGALVLPVTGYPDYPKRVIRAAFLHFGLLHLLMNSAGLIIFGQRLEEAWGFITTTLAYLLCAILSIYLLTVIHLGATVQEPFVLVGASGGVMGLIGCLLGFLGWGQLVRRNRLVASEFKLLFLIIVFQMVFDQMTPNVSSECHLMGMLIGVCCGLLVGVTKHLLIIRKRAAERKLLPASS